MALVPMRNLVLFPQLLAPVGLGRPKSVAALQHALAHASPIGLVLQKDAQEDEPGRSGLCSVGTVAEVLLLDIDRDHRAAAQAGSVPTIAPRRFNPQGEAWLPVLHAQRGDWHFTALYSNTARAHELGRVHDWVVVYAVGADHGERQHTVVTARSGVWLVCSWFTRTCLVGNRTLVALSGGALSKLNTRDAHICILEWSFSRRLRPEGGWPS